MRIAIITPSRMKPSTLAGKSGQYFLEHAVESANSQTAAVTIHCPRPAAALSKAAAVRAAAGRSS